MKEEKKVEFKYRPDVNADPGVQQFKIIVEMVDKANSLGLDGKKLKSFLASPSFSDTDSKTFRMIWDYDSSADEEHLKKRREMTENAHRWSFRMSVLFIGVELLSLLSYFANQFVSKRAWIPGDGAFIFSFCVVLFFYWDSTRLLKKAHKREDDYGEMINNLMRVVRRKFGN